MASDAIQGGREGGAAEEVLGGLVPSPLSRRTGREGGWGTPEALGGLRETLESSVKPTCRKGFKNSSGPFDKSTANYPGALAPRPRCLRDGDVFGEKRGEAAREPSQSEGLQPAGDSQGDARRSGRGWGERSPSPAPPWLAIPGSFLVRPLS